MFETNIELLGEIKERLKNYAHIYWVIGGSGSGKTTVTKAIAEEKGIARFDMDEYVYGHFGARYTMERHPAIKTWFSAENPLGWILGLALADYDALNRASNVEFLDLFAEEMAKRDTGEVLLVDGGITHPSVLAEVLPVARILCIDIDTKISHRIWNEDPERAQMKDAVLALPEGERAWEKFLGFDAHVTETILRESGALKIKTIKRGTEDLNDLVTAHFEF